jgi:hypothetical protein
MIVEADYHHLHPADEKQKKKTKSNQGAVSLSFASSSSHQQNEGNSLPPRADFDSSSTLNVGSMVWARYSGNKQYYSGKITKKSGQGSFTTYSVRCMLNFIIAAFIPFLSAIYLILFFYFNGCQLL